MSESDRRLNNSVKKVFTAFIRISQIRSGLFHLSDRDYASYILNFNTTVIKSIAVQLFLH